jgi:hypothetical protein
MHDGPMTMIRIKLIPFSREAFDRLISWRAHNKMPANNHFAASQPASAGTSPHEIVGRSVDWTTPTR